MRCCVFVLIIKISLNTIVLTSKCNTDGRVHVDVIVIKVFEHIKPILFMLELANGGTVN